MSGANASPIGRNDQLMMIRAGILAALLLVQPAGAQTRFTYSKGQSVSPAYEGWMPNEDGSFTLYFGYMNANWLEEFDVPIGPDNNIEPGGPDQGQPTHFYPRRNPFLFTIRLPKDFVNTELIWSLTTHGRTEKAYASLKTDYQIDKQVISTEVGGDGGSLRDELRYNIPPELEVEGEAPRSVKAGESLTLVALAGDPDNLPARRDGKPQPRHAGKPASEEPEKPAAPRAASANSSANVANLVYRPPSSIVPNSGPGLRLSWFVYRGKASAVTFSPEQMKTWTDTRAWANSPWSPPFTIPEPPPDGKWVTEVAFQEPGDYVLRAVASDGSLFTYRNVMVTVTRPPAADLLAGTWKLNAAKSRYNPGPAFLNNTIKFEPVVGGFKLVADGIDSQGKRIQNEYITKFDGKDYPTKQSADGKPNPNAADAVSWKKIDDYRYEQTNKFKGKTLTVARHVISKDGKTRTVTTTGVNLQGQRVENLLVFEKQ